MNATNNPVSEPTKSFKEFLESTPPEIYEELPDIFDSDTNSSGNRYWTMATPDLLLHCSSEECSGYRFFKRAVLAISPKKDTWARGFLTYICKSCRRSLKHYALTVRVTSLRGGEAYKFGEIPVYGPPTPARVITLIGPDRDHFLLGRRAENHGLGIGAFAYYRRVVENQKGRIINEIAKLAKKLGASAEVLQDFQKAASETQFKTAIDDIKAGLPSVLMIDGHNPLTLLHTALSEGLHAEDDKACLELAQSIRTVLTELAERISLVRHDGSN